MEDLVKRMMTQDGKHRLSIYRESYPTNPRDLTDFPINCEDWSHDYSIMNDEERDRKSANAGDLLAYLLCMYGIRSKIIPFLVANGKAETHERYDNALIYDRSRKEWDICQWYPSWTSVTGTVIEGHWEAEYSFCLRLDEISVQHISDYLTDRTVDKLIGTCLNDGVKVMGYGFDYYGGVWYSREFDSDCTGIAYIVKEDAVHDGGWFTAKEWKDKDCFEMAEWLFKELDAWATGEVYGFTVEEGVSVRITKEYLDGDHEIHVHDSTEWKETDACWGFYGELSKSLEWILSQAGFKMDELTEVA